ncbi:DUF3160 domain-containing protein [Thiospirochaeta perfilievii]|uniref:DUF3160 domain-containing protein n=1 Tax=Thiospirochaeta perfilievii TaxID=252967 RepID=A0A5C1Q748_9SPIO|nr:DUF3160 domain-containing protein [Thiospirochaeta perfilievii]QEN03197.1 DUF3160 domain-containing protein [Thiospirochaeta perfilievii]
MNKIKVIFFYSLVLLLFSCSNSKSDINKEIIEVTIPTIEEPEIIEEKEESPEIDKKPLSLNIINEEIEWGEFDEVNFESDHYAVVANKKTVLYKNIDIYNKDDIKNLEEELTIEIGTILPIKKTIMLEDTILENYFKFKGDTNYFYLTEYNSEPYIVWGANLHGDINNKLDAQKLSYYYTKEISSETFIPYSGSYNLSNKTLNNLSINRVDFQKLDTEKSILNHYKEDLKDRSNITFITTDLFSTTLFNIIDNLTYVYSKEVLDPQILELSRMFIRVLKEYESQDDKLHNNYTNLLNSTLNLFELTTLLITLDMSEVKKQIIKDELNLIESKKSKTTSPILGNSFDYTLFERESKFSKSIIWLLNSSLKPENLMLVNKIVYENSDLRLLWQNINRDIRYLLGDSKDLDFNGTTQFIDDYIFSIFPSWIDNKSNMDDFIISHKLYNENFRFFGRAFNYDDEISNRINNIKYYTPLDFMSIIGSSVSKSLIKQTEVHNEYYNQYEEVIENIKDSITLDNRSLYSGSINLLKSIFSFEQNRDFFFAEKGKWNQKILFTSHTLLTRIKSKNLDNKPHENVEIMTDPTDITFDVLDFSRPNHYIEPNIDFYNSYLLVITSIMENLDLNSLSIDYISKFENLTNIIMKVLEILEREVNIKELDLEMNDYIVTIPTLLYKIEMEDNSSYFIDRDTINRIDSPYRLYLALDDKVYGKRVAVGYINHYKVNDNNLEQPFWTEDNLK